MLGRDCDGGKTRFSGDTQLSSMTGLHIFVFKFIICRWIFHFIFTYLSLSFLCTLECEWKDKLRTRDSQLHKWETPRSIEGRLHRWERPTAAQQDMAIQNETKRLCEITWRNSEFVYLPHKEARSGKKQPRIQFVNNWGIDLWKIRTWADRNRIQSILALSRFKFPPCLYMWNTRK